MFESLFEHTRFKLVCDTQYDKNEHELEIIPVSHMFIFFNKRYERWSFLYL